MNNTTSKILYTNAVLIYGSLVVLALGLVTSISILALSHILMIVPILFFLPKTSFKNWSLSTWGLAAMTVVIILSIVLNQDIAIHGYKPLGKVKYFIFGLLSIAPLSFYFKKFQSDKKISILLYVFCVATTFASVVGMFSQYETFNPVTLRNVAPGRNAGLFGMVMNYAYNVSYFQIIVLGLVIYRKEIQKYINLKFLYFVFVINLAGLYLTYTRGAWLGFLAAIPFFLLKFNKKYFAIVIVALALIGGIACKIAADRVIRPQSDRERMSQWMAAIKAFEERPLLGYGYLNFEHHSVEIKKRYDLGELKFKGHAHGNIFEMLGATGILGLLSFMFWSVTWFVEMYKKNDIISKITLPFIVVFFVGGITQSTIALGINLFFVMAAYSISQIDKKVLNEY